MPVSTTLPDFSSAEHALTACGGALGIADAHGLLCALLCTDRALPLTAWLEALDADAGASVDTILVELHATSAAQLAPEHFDFVPLLPDDRCPLAERVAALGGWSEGFLVGLGLAGTARLADEAGEFVTDLSQIARATTTGNVADEVDEEGENDYAELVEYLRAGVQLVRDALLTRAPTPGPGGRDESH